MSSWCFSSAWDIKCEWKYNQTYYTGKKTATADENLLQDVLTNVANH